MTAAKELSELASWCQDALRHGDRVIADTVQTLEEQLDLLRGEMIPTLYGPPTFEDEMLSLSSMLE